jgi:hypothetical protein
VLEGTRSQWVDERLACVLLVLAGEETFEPQKVGGSDNIMSAGFKTSFLTVVKIRAEHDYSMYRYCRSALLTSRELIHTVRTITLDLSLVRTVLHLS